MISASSPRSLTASVLALLPYLFALAGMAATTAALHFLRTVINPSMIALLYLLPVGVSTALWGLGPGILSALSGFLAFNYFFIVPYYSLAVRHTQDLLVLVAFLTVAIVLNQLIGRSQRNLAVATAREYEAVRLHELGTSLARLQDERAIVHFITEKVFQTFQPERVEVMVEARNGQAAVYAALPEGDRAQALSEEPGMVVPIQTVRGLLGEFRLWRGNIPFTSAEERLVRTFSNQGALAIERARLSQADTRARVLEESDRLKSALLSSVSHELRTPLATIKAAVSSLRSGAVEWESEARPDLLAAIEEETDHLNQLVGNLLNMSRIEAGALKLERKWNVLEEIVASVVHRLRQRRALEHTILVDIPEELPLVSVDYILMEQVFVNLLDNSMKYSPVGTKIVIRARQSAENRMLVEVSNQGPPAPPEQFSRIFDKFYRGAASDRVTGSGLGLSICKGIVEAHGGQIWAENLPDGFIFKFTLPLPREAATPDL